MNNEIYSAGLLRVTSNNNRNIYFRLGSKRSLIIRVEDSLAVSAEIIHIKVSSTYYKIEASVRKVNFPELVNIALEEVLLDAYNWDYEEPTRWLSTNSQIAFTAFYNRLLTYHEKKIKKNNK